MTRWTPPGRILFLQLPRLDNENRGLRENFPMAGFYLFHSLERTGEASHFEARFLTPDEEALDDAHLIERVVEWRPDVVCCTLYLWNIERTLHLLKAVREYLPLVIILAGGPEVSFSHPFLLRSLLPDVVVVGEGEGVFPHILRALHGGSRTHFTHVAWKRGRRYEWGVNPQPVLGLGESLPSPEHPGWKPDPNGMAYLETGRGCPMRCSYCRYPHLRRQTSFMSAPELKERVKILIHRGAREIRFVDPTFNANPAFEDTLRSLQRLNASSHIQCFAEMQAQTLTPHQISLLRAAGFSEIEVGVQSRDPEVLRRSHRPVHSSSLEENLRLMIRKGIRLTIDLMYGLPGQTRQEVSESLRWAWGLKPAYVQCLQTLLLPGTELRRNRRRWKMATGHLPPYGVLSTDSLSSEDIREIEVLLHRGSPSDGMTREFVAYRLPDLFEERVELPVDGTRYPDPIPGRSSRRALVFRGQGLFAHRAHIVSVIGKAIREEPHALWQFVLNTNQEEPLDLLEEMIAQIRRFPAHWIDRFASVAAWDRIASRRVFVLLRRGRQYSRSWIEAAEKLLEDHFY